MAATSEVNQMRGEIHWFNYDFIEKGKKECKGRWLVKVNHNYNEIERKNKYFLK